MPMKNCILLMCHSCLGLYIHSLGVQKSQSIDNILSRAIRYFMGVHRFAPPLETYGDTVWIPSQYKLWINII